LRAQISFSFLPLIVSEKFVQIHFYFKKLIFACFNFADISRKFENAKKMPIAIDRGFIERAFRSEQLGEQPCLQVLVRVFSRNSDFQIHPLSERATVGRHE